MTDDGTMSQPYQAPERTQPREVTYKDAYLVAGPDGQGGYGDIGVVRRDGAVWRYLVLGRSPLNQPKDVFASRADAARALLQAVASS